MSEFLSHNPNLDIQTRRKVGDFWTPKVWVDESHRRIEKVLGEDWKEKYVVWDNCCGGKNLTRDYKFKELYSSTLFQSELNMSSDYNPEGTAFQFDFLNDPLEKLPDGLKAALEEDKPFVFFLNPPYSVAGGGIYKKNGMVAAGSSKTETQKVMKRDGMGKCTNDISKQFIYRICKIREKYNLSNCHICLFSGIGFMSVSSDKELRKVINSNFKHEGGYLINAGEFANVSSSWGISFTQFGPGQYESDEYKLDVLSQVDFEITKIGEKTIYNLDHRKKLPDWCDNGKRRNGKMKEVLSLKTGLFPIGDPIYVPDDFMGVQMYNTNNVAGTDGLKLFMVTPYNSGFNKFYINPDNFEKVMTIHAVRWIPEGNWLNSDDSFSTPNESDPHLTQFMRDSLIYSLFDNANYCTSTDHDFNNRHWDINNEFFWMSRDEMISLADEHHNDAVYKDAIKDDDRYVYKYIKTRWDEFSPDAQHIYSLACDLVRKTFPYRDIFNSDHPEVQVNHWDAGWTQIKKILKEYFPDDLKDFRKEFKAFEERMRPLVYELGFLRDTYIEV